MDLRTSEGAVIGAGQANFKAGGWKTGRGEESPAHDSDDRIGPPDLGPAL